MPTRLGWMVLVVMAIEMGHLANGQAGPGIAGGKVPSEIDGGGWRQGRATFYGASPAVVQAYEPVRGHGSFGVIPFGSCGFTNSEGQAAYPSDASAALADTNPDFPGSCGRCYQVKCSNGLVLGENGKPVSIHDFFYLAGVNRTVKDTKGRSFPGNPQESEGLQYVECWNDTAPATVTITDTCPCNQQLPGEVRTQQWCCGDQYHMDLSFYAFEKLAHPVYGVMMIDFRPVDCDTGKVLQFTPGYISRDLYRDKVGTGWEWFPYSDKYRQFSVDGAGVDGSAATCMTITKGGGLSLRCPECYRESYQPFAGVSAVQFSIRGFSGDPKQPSANESSFPLKVFVLNNEKKQYCNNEVQLTNLQPTATSTGGWRSYRIPMSDFQCQGGTSLNTLDRIDWQNTSQDELSLCFDDIALK